jgi:sugar/nucleoside kinase (ribokinase family)
LDSNGAGDAFTAGFLYGYTRQAGLKECLRLGTVTAGLCVTSPELAHPDLSPELVEGEYRKSYPI